MVDRSWNNEVVRWKLGLAYWVFRVSRRCVGLGLLFPWTVGLGRDASGRLVAHVCGQRKEVFRPPSYFDHLLEQVLDPNQIFRCRYTHF
jgi:hypothetical protein